MTEVSDKLPTLAVYLKDQILLFSWQKVQRVESLKEGKKAHVLTGVPFEPSLWCAHNCFYDQHISDFFTLTILQVFVTQQETQNYCLFVLLVSVDFLCLQAQ